MVNKLRQLHVSRMYCADIRSSVHHPGQPILNFHKLAQKSEQSTVASADELSYRLHGGRGEEEAARGQQRRCGRRGSRRFRMMITTARRRLLLAKRENQRRRGPAVPSSSGSGRRLWWQRRGRRRRPLLAIAREPLHDGHELVRVGVDDPRRALVHDHGPGWSGVARLLGRPGRQAQRLRPEAPEAACSLRLGRR